MLRHLSDGTRQDWALTTVVSQVYNYVVSKISFLNKELVIVDVLRTQTGHK